ncbi:MAG TPA: FIST C-terminal domain-containing protein, partial [Methylotenera sp.]|nr:FIST C-terminal domain-containing protein [Methylotenera sp.]
MQRNTISAYGNTKIRMKVATSIVIGRTANPNLATQAVMQAMHKADITIANSVLLLLSSEFANNPQPAIRAAAKAGNCTQVFGCSAAGIFTEDDWVLDAPAAAAMVFSGYVGIQLAKSDIAQRAQQALLTLTAPNAINSTWLNDGHDRYGGVSGDVVGQGPFSVWQNSKGESSGRVEAVFSGVKLASSASHGLKILTKPKKIQSTETFDITLLDNKPPLFNLQKAWEADCKGKITAKDATLPLHLMMAVYANSAEAIMTGEFSQTHLISYDEALGSVTLAQALQPGQFLCWGIRDSETAQNDLRQTTQTLLANLDAKPDFGLLFSCIGRGPFYDGIDHDLNVITATLPKMPLLGFYGNGEIARIGEHNQLLPYS